MKDFLRAYLSETEINKIGEITKDTEFIISGKQGPTGKTTLCRELKNHGYNAKETWEIAEEKGNNNSVKIVISLSKSFR